VAIDTGRGVNLFAKGGQTRTVTVDLGQPRLFLASIAVNMIDSLDNFDSDNAIAADIFLVDGVRTSPLISGGAHWGGAGAITNVHQATVIRVARTVTFRLRAFHTDIDACAQGWVVV
jgi:hypothetical protein